MNLTKIHVTLATVTNYYKLPGLTEHIFIFLYSRRSEIQNQFHWKQIKVSAELHSLPRLSGRQGSLALTASGDCRHP